MGIDIMGSPNFYSHSLGYFTYHYNTAIFILRSLFHSSVNIGQNIVIDVMLSPNFYYQPWGLFLLTLTIDLKNYIIQSKFQHVTLLHSNLGLQCDTLGQNMVIYIMGSPNFTLIFEDNLQGNIIYYYSYTPVWYSWTECYSDRHYLPILKII